MNSLMCKSDSMPSPVSSKEGEASGPSLYLNAEQVKAMFGKDVPKVDENYATGIEFRVRSVTKRSDGLNVQLELTGCECCEGAEETKDSEEED